MDRCILVSIPLVLVLALAGYGCTRSSDPQIGVTASGSQPDLTTQGGAYGGVWLCDSYDGGRVGGLDIVVTNQGDAATGPFIVSAFGVWQAIEDGLDAGEYRHLWYSYFRDAHAGIQVDTVNQVRESDELNNVPAFAVIMTNTPPGPCTPRPTPTAYPSDFPTPPRADLQIESVRASQPLPYCTGAHSRDGIRVAIANRGDEIAGPFLIRVAGVYASIDTELAPGDSTEFWVDMAGRELDTIKVELDLVQQVAEYDETNNAVAVPYITSTPPPVCQQH